jgi:O-antigen/teichoic acid export membrane protein
MTIAPRTLMAGGAVLVAGQAVQAVVAFGANLVLVAYISPGDFGRFALILATASLVLSVLSLRINTLIIRTRAPDFTLDREERYFSALTFETLAAAVVGLAWVQAAGFSGVWATVLVCVLCARHWVDQNKAYFERQMPYVRLGLLESGAALTAHAASVALVLVGFGPDALYWREVLLLALSTTGLAYLRGLTWRRLRWLPMAEWRLLLREARGIWLDSALDAVYQRLVIQLAGVVGGDKGAGYFFQAQRLAMLPHVLITPLVGRMAATWFGRVEAPERRRGRDHLLGVLALPLIAGAAIAFFYADPLVPWLFGEPWRPAAPLFAALSGLVLFISLFEVLRTYCLITKQARLLLAGRVAQYGGLLTTLVIGVVAGDPLTVQTLAVGVSIGFGVSFVVIWIVLAVREWHPNRMRA